MIRIKIYQAEGDTDRDSEVDVPGLLSVVLELGESSSRLYIPALSTAEEEEEIRWYLEDHISQPFERTRGQKAFDLIHNYATALAAAIGLPEVIVQCMNYFLETYQNNPLMALNMGMPQVHIEVFTPANGTSRLQRIHWETLEQHTWRPELKRSLIITVVRTVQQDPNGSYSASDSCLTQSAQDLTRRILVVIARPRLAADLAHTFMLVPILNAIQYANGPSGKIWDFEIARPGTLDSLTRCLELKSSEIVHFDLHGVESNGQ